ncbi:MAG: hypothetical protein NC124_10500 [Clostridium sp.]|nr:hypothetical protein [Clostridium sp.]
MIEDEFIEFENNSSVLKYKYRYRDILIWPYIRDLLLRKVILSKYGLLPNIERRGKENKYRDYIKYNSFNLPRKDILFFSPSSALIESDYQIFDRLIDGLVEVDAENSVKIVQYNQDFNFEKLSGMGIPFSVDTFIQKIIAYEGKRQKVSREDQETINQFVEYLKKNIPFEVEEGIYEAIRKQAIAVIKRYPAYYKYYQKLIDIVRPRAVIFHCGVYGLPEVKVFNDSGVVTAEYQHGSIDRHWDYMYGKSVAEDDIYREYMPKYLLTWGDYWTRNMNIPANIYKIGNPTIRQNIENFKKIKSNDDDQFNILLVTGNEHKWYVEFIDYVLNNLPEKFRLIVKLHPLRPDDAGYYKSFLHNERVDVKHEGSIYGYFAICKYIIGDMSTAMYEATAIGKDVFIVDNELTRNYMNGGFGIKVQNGQQFIEKMNTKRKEKFCSEDFFEKDWKENYSRFLKEIVYENR